MPIRESLWWACECVGDGAPTEACRQYVREPDRYEPPRGDGPPPRQPISTRLRCHGCGGGIPERGQPIGTGPARRSPLPEGLAAARRWPTPSPWRPPSTAPRPTADERYRNAYLTVGDRGGRRHAPVGGPSRFDRSRRKFCCTGAGEPCGLIFNRNLVIIFPIKTAYSHALESWRCPNAARDNHGIPAPTDPFRLAILGDFLRAGRRL